MSFFEDAAGHRGLQFLRIAIDDKASIAIDNTKVHTTLDGSTSMTYEAVIDGRRFSTSYTRFIHIGMNQDHTLTLETKSGGRVSSEVNSEFNASAPADLTVGRVVLHAVLDTTQANPDDRYHLYINGAHHPTLESNPPPQDLAIALGTGRELVLGNRTVGSRAMEGVLYYAAIYSSALSDEQVAQNAALLLINDDTPSSADTRNSGN